MSKLIGCALPIHNPAIDPPGDDSGGIADNP